MGRLILTGRCFFSLLLLAGLAACGGEPDGKDGKPPLAAAPIKVITTLPVLQEAVIKIGGEAVESFCLRRPDDGPGTFDLHAGDVRAIASADLIFVIGAGHEGAMLDAIAANARGKVVRLAEHRDAAALRGAQSPSEPADECWVNPLVMRQFVVQVEAELAAMRPAAAAKVAANSAAYQEQLRTLAAWIEMTVKPVKRGPVLTNSSVAAAVAKACWTTVIQIELAPESAITAEDRERVSGAVRATAIKVIAIDPGSNEALREMLAEIAEAHGIKLVTPPLAPPPSDSSTPYADWLQAQVKAMVRHF